jgi:hypothetical protein
MEFCTGGLMLSGAGLIVVIAIAIYRSSFNP